MAAGTAAGVDRALGRLQGLDAAALDERGRRLFNVAALLGTQPALRRALTSQSAPLGAKQQLLRRVLGAQLDDGTLDTVGALLDERWGATRELVDAVDDVGVAALLRAAEQAGRLDEVEDEIFRFARVVEREPQLSLALSDPALPADRKRSLVHQLLDGKAAAETVALVERTVLAPRGRSVERALGSVVDAAAARRDRLVAVARSARPLDGAQVSRLTAALSATYGRPVQVQTELDPDLLGGVSVRVGDEVVDASVARRLADVRRRFTA